MTNDTPKHGLLNNSPISVGRFTYGVDTLTILTWGEGAALKIGSFCSIAPETTIFLGGNHRIDWTTTFPFGHIFTEELGGADIKGHPATKGDVIIGDDVWLARGATVMSGVSVGSGAVIAANATVVKDVPPYHIVGGNPAQPIRQRFGNEEIELLLKLRWWDLPVATIREINRELSAPPDIARLKEWLERYRPD